MKEISLDNLSKFKEIFIKAGYEKHVVIILTIRNFIERFEKFPELKSRAKLYALDNEWEKEGIFFMTFKSSEVENNIFLDAISSDSIEKIESALKKIDFTTTTFLFSIRNEYRPMVLEMYKSLNLNFCEDTDTVCYWITRENAEKFQFVVPENFQMRSLTLGDVDKVNSAWPHRYEGSEKFVEYSIKFHISLGLFHNDGTLVAWCLRYDNGGLAILQVDERYLRRGFGSLIVKGICKKIAQQSKCDIISTILHENTKSINLFKNLGFIDMGGHTWFGLKFQE